MASPDDIVRLRALRDAGRISPDEYTALRRYVLWGTPLPPELVARYKAAQAPRSVPAERVDRPERSEPAQPESTGEPVEPPGDKAERWRARRSAWSEPQEPQSPRPEPQPLWSEATAIITSPDKADRLAGRTEAIGSEPAGAAVGELDREPGTDLVRRPGGPPSLRQPTGDRERFGDSDAFGPRSARRHARAASRAGSRSLLALPSGELPARGRRQLTLIGSAVCVLVLVAVGAWWFVVRVPTLTPAQFARNACGAVRSWQDDVAARRDQLVDQIGDATDAESIAAVVEGFYSDAEARTAHLSVELGDLGDPDVTGGPGWAKSLRATIGDTATRFHDEATFARDLDTGSAAFGDTIQNKLASMDATWQPVIDALSGRDPAPPAALRDAFTNEPTCAAYTG